MTLLDHIARESATVFARSTEFGETVTFTPAGGPARSELGVFDRVSELSDIGELLAADGIAATLNVHEADFLDARKGDLLSVRGYDYRVVGLEPDGTGRLVMVLGI